MFGEKALNALRQLIDELYGGRFPGLYLLVTGTPAFLTTRRASSACLPLSEEASCRDSAGEDRFDNPRAWSESGEFRREGLMEVGPQRCCDLVAEGSPAETRIRALADGAYLTETLARNGGRVGGCVGLAPRLYLRSRWRDSGSSLKQFSISITAASGLTLAGAELSLERPQLRWMTLS